MKSKFRRLLNAIKFRLLLRPLFRMLLRIRAFSTKLGVWVGIACVVVSAAVFGNRFWDELHVNISVNVPVLPQRLLDSGIDPNLLLRGALSEIPTALARLKEQLGRDTTRLVAIPEPITIGAETFCSAGNFRRLAIPKHTYFSNGPRISVNDGKLTALVEAYGGTSLVNGLRSWLGISHYDVTLNLIDGTDGYYLRSTLSSLVGSRVGAKERGFTQPIQRATAENIQNVVIGELLRFAYPELTVLFRTFRSRATLDIEEYMADAYPSSDRKAMLRFAMFTAIASDADDVHGKGIERLVRLGLDHDLAMAATNFDFNVDEIAFSQIAAYQLMLSGNAESAELRSNIGLTFIQAKRDFLEKYAKHLGVPFERIADDDPVELRITLPSRIFSELWRFSMLDLEPSANRLSENFDRVSETIGFARTNRLWGSLEARNALHDEILLAVWSTIRPLIRPYPTEEADVAKIGRRYLEFYKSDFQPLIMDGNVFEDREVLFIDSVAVLASVVDDNLSDAASLTNKVRSSNDACGSYMLAKLLTAIKDARPSATLNALFQPLVVALLQDSINFGLRNSDVYDSLGTALTDVKAFDEAHQAFRDARRFDGVLAWMAINEGRAYLREGRFGDAETYYRKSLADGFKQCQAEDAAWSDIEAREVDLSQPALQALRQAAPTALFDELASVKTDTPEGCSTEAALRGLLESLERQKSWGAFIEVYENYLGRNSSSSLRSELKEKVLEDSRYWQCRGEPVETPFVPSQLADKFPVRNGRFVCKGH